MSSKEIATIGASISITPCTGQSGCTASVSTPTPVNELCVDSIFTTKLWTIVCNNPATCVGGGTIQPTSNNLKVSSSKLNRKEDEGSLSGAIPGAPPIPNSGGKATISNAGQTKLKSG